ncbi:MAG: AI-2E family transporter [Firmicutes bacterium]|nr:AI-2E family transporter [Bacillota bacterium]
MKQKIINACIYAAAVFAAVYGTKYLIDGAVYIFVNMGSMFRSAADIFVKLLHIFAILVFGLITAYILDPLADGIEKRLHVSRTAAAVIIYLAIIFLAVFSLAGLINRIYIYDKNDLLNAFSLAFEHYRARLFQIYTHIYTFAAKHDLFGVLSRISEAAKTTDTDYIAILHRIGTLAADLFLGLVLAFYFLKDKQALLFGARRIFTLLTPKKIQPVILYIIHETDSVFSGYIRGQLADAVIMSVLASSLLTILRIPFAAVIGIITGFTNIIPYLGALVGLLLSAGAAILDGNIGRAAAAVVVMLILQQIDSIVIAPRLVGERVSLSPAAVIASLGIAGNLFGLWGMVFAVPSAALIKIFSLRLIKKLDRKRLRIDKI